MFVFSLLAFTFSNAPWNVHCFLWINFVLKQLLNILSGFLSLTVWKLISWARSCHKGKLLKKFFTVRNKTKAFYLPGSFVIVYRSHFMFILIFVHIYLFLVTECRIFCCGIHCQLPHGTWDLNSLTRDQTCVPCTGVGCHFLFQGTFLMQGSNSPLLHCRQILYHWATLETL